MCGQCSAAVPAASAGRMPALREGASSSYFLDATLALGSHRISRMKLKDKLLNVFAPVTLFEMVPPAEGRPEAIERSIEEVKRIRALADAINLPEIRDENRGEARAFEFIPRVEPRALAERIAREAGTEVLINRGVVYEAGQLGWFRETRERFGVESVGLVGGESSRFAYPGPTVLEAAG